MKKRKQDYTSTPFKSPLRQLPKLEDTKQAPKTLPTKLTSRNNPVNINSPLHNVYRPKSEVNHTNSDLQKSLDNLPNTQKYTSNEVTEFSTPLSKCVSNTNSTLRVNKSAPRFKLNFNTPKNSKLLPNSRNYDFMKNTSSTYEPLSIGNSSNKASLLIKKQQIVQEIKRIKDEISLLQTAITVSKKENGAEVVDLIEKWKNICIDSSEQLYKLIEPALISSSNLYVQKLTYCLFSRNESRKESDMTAYSRNQNLNVYTNHESIADRCDYNENNEYSSTYSNINGPQGLQKQDSTCSTGSNEDMYCQMLKSFGIDYKKLGLR
ncbi:hypothetical protein AYI69_g10546 [Smittium culicis]|uniref:Uncharacterized protein n=2 Tax=Smittium culicis TaxID=133412 RepID=A0A1R1X4Z1_9FUNG|nr:hypothetical protein AYI69_g10546 [Smittium culicis]